MSAVVDMVMPPQSGGRRNLSKLTTCQQFSLLADRKILHMCRTPDRYQGDQFAQC
jgi:hypothetical protein